MNAMLICAIFDGAAQRFMDPFVVPTATVAERAFEVLVNRPGTNQYEFPGDYTLYRIGTYYPEDGMLETTPHERVCGGLNVVRDPQDREDSGVRFREMAVSGAVPGLVDPRQVDLLEEIAEANNGS